MSIVAVRNGSTYPAVTMPAQIHRNLTIPDHELEFAISRSGGPGGQHVNKVATRVTLRFDIEASTSLSDAQKRRILTALDHRISRNGTLSVSCGRHRSQTANRRETVERFAELIRSALARRRRRVATGVPRGQRRQRLDDKKRRSRLKQARGGRIDRDD